MVNFKLDGVSIIGFLSYQNVILGNSLEIDCQDSLNTIIDHDDYKKFKINVNSESSKEILVSFILDWKNKFQNVNLQIYSYDHNDQICI